MQSQATSVEEYLGELSADRRAAIETVRKVIRKNLDKDFEEGMQYGMIGYFVPHRIYPPGYHCDPKQPLPFVCLASQKNYLSLYMGCVYASDDEAKRFHEQWAATGKKLDMGKSCIRFKKVEDLALDVIGETIRRMTVKKFIHMYESVIKDSRKRTTTKTTKTRNAARASKSPARKKAARKGSR